MYIRHFPTYTLVYGALAALPILLLWLFAAWMSVLIGALLAANLRFWGLPTGNPHHSTPQADFNRLHSIVEAIARAAPEPVPSERFQAAFDRDARAADRAAQELARLGYMVRVWPVSTARSVAGVWDELWLPAPGLPAMTLMPLFDWIWTSSSVTRNRPAGGSGASDSRNAAAEWLSQPIGERLMGTGASRAGRD